MRARIVISILGITTYLCICSSLLPLSSCIPLSGGSASSHEGVTGLANAANKLSENFVSITKRAPKTDDPASPSSSKLGMPNHSMHSHMSRKILDRACKASKDTLDEVMQCIIKNELYEKHRDKGKKCFKETFNEEFNHDDMAKHRDLLCKNKDKMEEMTSCMYHQMMHLDQAELDRIADAMVDVGMCIINALDD